jgi:hypothetical protein
MIPAISVLVFVVEWAFEFLYYANAAFFGIWMVMFITELTTTKVVGNYYRLAAAVLSCAIHAALPGINRLIFTSAELIIIAVFVGSLKAYERLRYKRMDLFIVYLLAGALSGFLYGGLFYYGIISNINDDTYGLKVVTLISAICWGILGYHAYFADLAWKYVFWFQFVCIFFVGIFYQPEHINKNN